MPPSAAKRRRLPSVNKACEFCRHRKIRCDGSQPCSKCQQHGRAATCHYDLDRDPKPRPTNKAIQQAEQRIRQLEDRLAGSTIPHSYPTHTRSSSSFTTASPDESPSATATATSFPAASDLGSSPASRGARVMSHLRVNHRGESHYHGPTSASFRPADIPAPPDKLRPPSSPPVNLDSSALADSLTAMSARERQNEVMNVVSAKLDFDGVDPELALHLLNLHWNRQHHAYLVTYRPLFMRDMAAPASEAKYFSKLLLNAILFGAAKFSDRVADVRTDVNDPSTAGAQFLKRVQELLPEALMVSRITTVQALLLLACTHYARGSESAAWLHSGLAFRMATDLGMNEDSRELVAAGKIQPEELEIRRRVVWAAYVIDKIHSLYQGRQSSMQFRHLYVPAEFYDRFEESELWTPVAYHQKGTSYTGPVYSVSTFTELCRLTVIMERIIQIFYSIDSASRPEGMQHADLQSLRIELEGWYKSLPLHLLIQAAAPSGPLPKRPPNVISLNALYYALTILLNRPFLSHGHLRTDDQAISRSSWKLCVDAASHISTLMSLYRQTVSMKGAPQLISYINFCAAGIHVRLAAQLQQHPSATSDGNMRAALKALKVCLDDFEENQNPNPGVVKAKTVIGNMADRSGILHLLQHHQDGGETASSGGSAAESDPAATNGVNRGGIVGGDPQPAISVNNFEIDFDSILSSFDNFEGSGGFGAQLEDSMQGIDPDMLFGFLRDTVET